jgi:hypothetical protein
MTIARQLAKYEEKGFTAERAQINVLMEGAAIAIFRDFPEDFVLFGGATLVLYHGSVRHSADLDLLSRTSESPSKEEVLKSLEKDLPSLAEAMGIERLRFELDESSGPEGKIYVYGREKERLFRVDLTMLGSAIESEIESHPIDDEAGILAVIKSATKELLLLQKAEAFLLRRDVKARDAYDVHALKRLPTKLNSNLRAHLGDTLLSKEIDSDFILERIEKVDLKRCRLELKPILPPDIYASLEDAEFEQLRQALRELYEEWL